MTVKDAEWFDSIHGWLHYHRWIYRPVCWVKGHVAWGNHNFHYCLRCDKIGDFRGERGRWNHV